MRFLIKRGQRFVSEPGMNYSGPGEIISENLKATPHAYHPASNVVYTIEEQEAEDRRQRRIGRLRTASRLPSGKTWETF